MDVVGADPVREVRDPEPPIRLTAVFYEPGSAEQVAAELRSLGEVVVGVGPGAHPVAESLGLPIYEPNDHGDRLKSHGDRLKSVPIPEGAYQETPVFPTDPDRVFWALQGRRLPAKRHPYGIQLRIAELIGDRISDEGGDLWHRRIEEIDDPRTVPDRLEESRVDAVIVDMQVGSKGGMAVVRSVRQATDEMTRPRTVLLLDRSADTFLARRAGADAAVLKPINAAELRTALGMRQPGAYTADEEE